MTWYVATCLLCTPRLPQPFRADRARRDWMQQHAAAHGGTCQWIVHDQHLPDPAGSVTG